MSTAASVGKVAPFLCECGCGESVGVWAGTDRAHGRVKGQPKRFIAHHARRVSWQPPLQPVHSTDPHRKPMPGYEGYYEVSDEGEVFSLWYGKHKRLGRILAANGYYYVYLSRGEGKGRTHTVHSLVLLAFRGERPSGYQCRHLNGIRSDSRLVNLAYGSVRENAADRLRHGTDNRGERHENASLTTAGVLRMRELYATGDYTQKEVGRLLGVTHSTVSRIVNRKAWTHV